MSNPKVKSPSLALLACLFALPSITHGQPDTLRGYIEAQRSALTSTAQPIVPATGKPGAIAIIENKTVPEIKAQSNAEARTASPQPAFEAFVPPAPRVLGVLTEPGQPARVSLISESGGVEWLLTVGESAPNSVWRVVSIASNSAKSHVVRLEASALPLPPPKGCKPSKNKPCVFTPATPHTFSVTL
jgi:hypothetical protein